MKFGVVVFPGSNCDTDCHYAVEQVLREEAVYIWHQTEKMPEVDALIIPGGFSYGDYLRCGAIARFSAVMPEIIRFAESGKLVLGICNGFQILTEAKLLPGALLRNHNLKFICSDVCLRVSHDQSPFTNQLGAGEVIKLPIAHGEGNYYCDPDTLAELESKKRVLFSYCSAEGEVRNHSNPNGSVANIAGIVNEQGNVLGMMPHPERCVEQILGGEDGLAVLTSMRNWIQGVQGNG